MLKQKFMDHAYQSANSLPETRNEVCMKHEDYQSTFYESFNCLRLEVF